VEREGNIFHDLVERILDVKQIDGKWMAEIEFSYKKLKSKWVERDLVRLLYPMPLLDWYQTTGAQEGKDRRPQYNWFYCFMHFHNYQLSSIKENLMQFISFDVMPISFVAQKLLTLGAHSIFEDILALESADVGIEDKGACLDVELWASEVDIIWISVDSWDCSFGDKFEGILVGSQRKEERVFDVFIVGNFACKTSDHIVISHINDEHDIIQILDVVIEVKLADLIIDKK
jgi:hypothetical protein